MFSRLYCLKNPTRVVGFNPYGNFFGTSSNIWQEWKNSHQDFASTVYVHQQHFYILTPCKMNAGMLQMSIIGTR